MYAYSHRPHTHDVRALECGVVFTSASGDSGSGSKKGDKKKQSNRREMVLSGGVDTQLCWLDVENFEKIRVPGKSLSMPPTSMFSVAKEKRLLMVQHDTNLKIWKLGQRATTIEAGEQDEVSLLSYYYYYHYYHYYHYYRY